jgi:sec-independent protein translocase protein TatC
MNLKKYSFLAHFMELKIRVFYIVVFYVISFAISYYFSSELLDILIKPLAKIAKNHTMIYTKVAEGFISYLRVSSYSAFFLSIPFIFFQIYKYLEPGLYSKEKFLIRVILILSIIIFYLGMIFVYYLVMPKAFKFFIGFENPNSNLPIKLFATISEYLTLSLHFMIVFGLIFEIPLLLATLCLLNIIALETLTSKRKIVILIAFILGGFLTPPDVFSQFALAIPIILLYEISIIILKIIDKKGAV